MASWINHREVAIEGWIPSADGYPVEHADGTGVGAEADRCCASDAAVGWVDLVEMESAMHESGAILQQGRGPDAEIV